MSSKRRCSTPTASVDDTAGEQAYDSWSLNIKRKGATRMAQPGVTALGKGWAIAGEPRLELSHSYSSECIGI
jgi:hypothetical protein